MEDQLKFLDRMMQSKPEGNWIYTDHFEFHTGPGTWTGYSDEAFAALCTERLNDAGIAVNEVEPAVIAELRRRYALPRFDGKDHQHG